MPRFFVDTPLTTNLIGQIITLPDHVTHHWCKVLRASVGDCAFLFDGMGGEYTVTLTHIDKKATEMGVHCIHLLTSDRCQAHLKYDRDFKKIAHWQSVAVAACEQCGMNIVPNIIAPILLDEWVANCQDELKLVLALSENNPACNKLLPKNISLLIGAEGGLSPREIDLAIHHGFVPWRIGERVLRTETAPVVALSALTLLVNLTNSPL
ncbi:RsmE family RNA methyltransferase [Moraxella catarrhalis]|uniref:RsmE family RNA methyltransferase n=1 Tax=Moraxella catarrhalis TaxID=480 RepID=UPI0007E2E379|nr:RsmE family RNA methyltransferase [Moraxella catarrhalis]OAV13284.1 Ribosomal RNA small subunit methyltransferase E [Moraxella catarrhalis]